MTQADLDVVVVGGGVTGVAIAASLSVTGKRIGIIERTRCGAAGATSLTGGIVRAYDRDRCVTHLASRAITELHTTHVGRIMQRALSRTGVLHAIPLSQEAAVRSAISRFSSSTYPMTLLSRDEAVKLTGFVEGAPERLYLWEPDGGHADAILAVRSLLATIRTSGLVLEGHQVLGVSGKFGDIEVRLRNGVLRAKVAVVAAGTWSRSLCTALPIVNHTIPFVRLWSPKPLAFPIIDAVAGTYARPLGYGIVQVGSAVRAHGVPPDCIPSPSIHQVNDAYQRFSAMTGWNFTPQLALDAGAGADGYSDDGRPICGFLNEHDGIYVAAAMCGIGYKLAPAIASIATADISAALSSRTNDEPGLSYLRPIRFRVAASPVEAQA
ncbi:FAD-binding oxidoreductase [Paraburkholderia fungorum]|uniref:NAD(P)/FAD-dependent oxidoreductase n=1 Tax=Paraburkholderia fungorum TaxID=134537 RepID=UPI00048047B9|nr:FAD-binding oxidoreductase [Paraburkholderia fungorum]PNE59683.1 FAD-binding oxidoreductase [Paraburkholderia fungorum]